MPKYRKKPVVIEAVQWKGLDTLQEVLLLASFESEIAYIAETGQLEIITLEGVMTASLSDWIIKGINGELYPCKPDIFEQTYDEIFEGCDYTQDLDEAVDEIIQKTVAHYNEVEDGDS